MSSSRRYYATEFRLNAVKLVIEEHRSQASVAAELQIPDQTLGSWVNCYRRTGKVPGENGSSRPVTEEQQTISQLKARVRELEAENKLIKKFVAYLAKNNVA